ncbi:hypothetical protein M8C21_018491, partial [Ambrosia artemisiifolia]
REYAREVDRECGAAVAGGVGWWLLAVGDVMVLCVVVEEYALWWWSQRKEMISRERRLAIGDFVHLLSEWTSGREKERVAFYRRGARRTNDVGDADDYEEMVQNYDHPYIQFPEGSVFHKKLQTLKNRNFDSSILNVNRADAITFNLGGMSRKFSIAEFGEVIGVYTAEETRNDGFKNSLTKLPDDITEEFIWAEIGEGIYEASNKRKATALYDPLYKYFHRVISESIGGRRVTGSGVNKKDLFFALLLATLPTCLPTILIIALGGMENLLTGIFVGGTYVTHIANELGILNEDNLEQISDPVLPSGIFEWKKLGRVFDGIGFRFVLNDDMWVPPPQTGDEDNDLALMVVEGEPSHPPSGRPHHQQRNEDQGRPRRPPSHQATRQETLQANILLFSFNNIYALEEQIQATHQQVQATHQLVQATNQLCLSNAQSLQVMQSQLQNHDLWFQWGVFETREELMSWVRNMTFVVTKRSKSAKNVGMKKLVAKRYPKEGGWKIKVKCDKHNHEPAQWLDGHAYPRRLAKEEFAILEDMTLVGVPPRNILTALKDRNSANISTIETIYDAQKKIRSAQKVECTPIQALMTSLNKGGYVHHIRADNHTNQVSHKSIPLNSIDSFWKHLDFSPALLNQQELEIAFDDYLEKFKDAYYKEAQPVVRRSWLQKLRGIWDPISTEYNEPEMQTNTRGRPTTKSSKSTKSKKQEKTTVPPPTKPPLQKSYSQKPPRHSSFVNTQDPPRHNLFVNTHDPPRHNSFVNTQYPPRHSSFVNTQDPPRHSSFANTQESPFKDYVDYTTHSFFSNPESTTTYDFMGFNQDSTRHSFFSNPESIMTYDFMGLNQDSTRHTFFSNPESTQTYDFMGLNEDSTRHSFFANPDSS